MTSASSLPGKFSTSVVDAAVVACSNMFDALVSDQDSDISGEFVSCDEVEDIFTVESKTTKSGIKNNSSFLG